MTGWHVPHHVCAGLPDLRPGLFWRQVLWFVNYEGDGVEELGTGQSEQRLHGLWVVLTHRDSDRMCLHHQSHHRHTLSH